VFENRNLPLKPVRRATVTNEGSKDKYEVNIEGTEHPWANPTITTEQIIELGNLPPDQGVIEIDLKTNTERTLAAGESIDLKKGQGFAKKVKYTRGVRL
jgi:hypothetical protein